MIKATGELVKAFGWTSEAQRRIRSVNVKSNRPGRRIAMRRPIIDPPRLGKVRESSRSTSAAPAQGGRFLYNRFERGPSFNNRSTWDGFISSQFGGPHFAGHRIFRGHSNPGWMLSSVWERVLEKKLADRKGSSIFSGFSTNAGSTGERFKDHAIGLPGGSIPRHCEAKRTGGRLADITGWSLHFSRTRAVTIPPPSSRSWGIWRHVTQVSRRECM